MRMPSSKARRRIVSDSAATAVGLAAAALSWQHIVHVARVYGHQADWAAYLYPVSVDGLMVVGVVKAADDRANGLLVRPWARIATWLGGLMSISAQVLSAMVYGWIAIGIAVAPSACLIVVTEVMARQGRKAAQAEAAQEQEAATLPATEMAVAPAVVAVERPSAPEGTEDTPKRVRRSRAALSGVTVARGPELPAAPAEQEPSALVPATP